MSKETEKIVLGSGKTYIIEFTGEIPEDSVIETALNLLGLIQGGATLEYKPTYYTAKDDLELVEKTILQAEEVVFKTGVMTWYGNTLKRLCSTARVSETGTKRIVKIGGTVNQDGKKYLIRFVHEDPTDGNIRVTIVGRNEAGFTLSFTKDKETVINTEFKCAPMDKTGTKIIYEEDIISDINRLTIVSDAGPTANTTEIAVDPALAAGNSYKYTMGNNLTLPEKGAAVGEGYALWDGNKDIPAVTGVQIMIVEVDSDSKAVAAGIATITANEGGEG